MDDQWAEVLDYENCTPCYLWTCGLERERCQVRFGDGLMEAVGLHTQIFHVDGTLVSKTCLVKGSASDTLKVRTIATLGHPESMDRETGLLGEDIVEVRSGGSRRHGYLFGKRGDRFPYIYSV